MYVCVCVLCERVLCVRFARGGAGRCSAAASMHNRHIFYMARVLWFPLIFALLSHTHTHTGSLKQTHTVKKKNASTRKLHAAVRAARSLTHSHSLLLLLLLRSHPYTYALSCAVWRRALFALLAGTVCWQFVNVGVAACLFHYKLFSRAVRVVVAVAVAAAKQQQTTSVPVASVITNYYYYFFFRCLPPLRSTARLRYRNSATNKTKK